MCLLHLLRSMCMSFIYLVKCPPKKNLHKVSHIFSLPMDHIRESLSSTSVSDHFLLRFCSFLWGKSIQRLHVSLTLHLVLMINTIYVESLSWLPWKHQEHQIPWNFVAWSGWKRKDPRCFEVRSIYTPWNLTANWDDSPRVGGSINLSFPETNSIFAPERWMGYIRRSFPFGARHIFLGDYVSFREGISSKKYQWTILF